MTKSRIARYNSVPHLQGGIIALLHVVTDIPPDGAIILSCKFDNFFILLVKEVAFCTLCKKTEDDRNTRISEFWSSPIPASRNFPLSKGENCGG